MEEGTEFGFGGAGHNLTHDGTESVDGSVEWWQFALWLVRMRAKAVASCRS
jgi:hypothetical protein